jgi:hypothetical protein
VVEIAGKCTDNGAKINIKPGDNGANKCQVVEILQLKDNMETSSFLVKYLQI